jgi:hypothetical protein
MFFAYYSRNNPIEESIIKSFSKVNICLDKLTYFKRKSSEDNLFSSSHCMIAYTTDSHVNLVKHDQGVFLLHGDINDGSRVLNAGEVASAFGGNESLETKPTSYRGNFVVIDYNDGENKLMVMNDPMGIHPVFIYEDKDCVILSSLPDLFRFFKLETGIEWDSIFDYICFGSTLPNTSLHQRISMLPAGTHCHYHDDKKKVLSFSTNLDFTPFDGTLDQAVDLYSDKFMGALNRLSRSYDIGSCFITGGSDTRFMIGSMDESMRSNLNFICYTNAEWSHGEKDVEMAKMLADRYNLKLDLRPSYQQPQNHSSPDAYKASKFYIVGEPTFSGNYGTETMGGIPLTYFGSIRSDINRTDFVKRFNPILGEDCSTRLGHRFDYYWDQILTEKGGSKEYTYTVKRLWRSQMNNLYSGRNTGNFIYSYSNSLKQKISPFMDDSCLEILFRLPQEYTNRYALYLAAFRNKLKSYAEVPFNSNIIKHTEDLPRLKSEITVGTINSFDHRKYVLDNIDNSFLARGPFCLSSVKRYLEQEISPLNKLAVRLCDLLVWYRTHHHDGNDNMGPELFSHYTL